MSYNKVLRPRCSAESGPAVQQTQSSDAMRARKRKRQRDEDADKHVIAADERERAREALHNAQTQRSAPRNDSLSARATGQAATNSRRFFLSGVTVQFGRPAPTLHHRKVLVERLREHGGILNADSVKRSVVGADSKEERCSLAPSTTHLLFAAKAKGKDKCSLLAGLLRKRGRSAEEYERYAERFRESNLVTFEWLSTSLASGARLSVDGFLVNRAAFPAVANGGNSDVVDGSSSDEEQDVGSAPFTEATVVARAPPRPLLELRPSSACLQFAARLREETTLQRREFELALRETQRGRVPTPLDSVRPSCRYTQVPRLEQNAKSAPSTTCKLKGKIASMRSCGGGSTAHQGVDQIADASILTCAEGNVSRCNLVWTEEDGGDIFEVQVTGPTERLRSYVHALQHHARSWSAADASAASERRAVSASFDGDEEDSTMDCTGAPASTASVLLQERATRVYPVYIFSRGRADTALLNYDAPHVFGRRERDRATPDVVIVVDPNEMQLYRAHHPKSVLLSLPEPGRAVGYARWVVSRLSSRGRLRLRGAERGQTVAVRTPFYWSCDDNIVSFSEIEMNENGTKCYVDHKLNSPVWLWAFLHAQCMEDLDEFALVGFLRDRGVALRCRSVYNVNVLSIYKVVLINARLLYRQNTAARHISTDASIGAGARSADGEDVTYVRRLSRFEDIALLYRCLHTSASAPLPTLKINKYAYRAVVLKKGGCSSERQRAANKGGVQCADDILESSEAPARVTALKPWERQIVDALVAWVKRSGARYSVDHVGVEMPDEAEHLDDPFVQRCPVQGRSDVLSLDDDETEAEPELSMVNEKAMQATMCEGQCSGSPTYAFVISPLFFAEPARTRFISRSDHIITTGFYLYPHQRKAMHFMAAHERVGFARGSSQSTLAPPVSFRRVFGCVLADDMGLGKTISTIALIASATPFVLLSSGAALGRVPTRAGKRKVRLPTLIVLPLTLLQQWRAELAKFAPALRVAVVRNSYSLVPSFPSAIAAISACKEMSWTMQDSYVADGRHGSEDASVDAEVVLTTYETLQSNHALSNVRCWYRIVLDEAHIVRNDAATPFKTCRAVVERVSTPPFDSRTPSHSCRVLCLTGTPIMNKRDELAALFEMIGIPKAFATKHLASLRVHLLLRRTKGDRDPSTGALLVNLPPKSVETRFVAFNTDYERACYQVLFSEAFAELERTERGGSALALLMRLRQAAVHPYLSLCSIIKNNAGRSVPPRIYNLFRRADELQACVPLESVCKALRALVHKEKVEGAVCQEEETSDDEFTDPLWWLDTDIVEPSTKVKVLISEIEAYSASKSLVHSNFTRALDLVEAELTRRGVLTFRIDGSIRSELRAAAITEFDAAPCGSVFLISDAGSVGLNLTSASRVYLLDAGYNPAKEAQAIDRVHRLGQTRDVFVTRFLIRGTVEEMMFSLNQEKRKIAADVLSVQKANGVGEGGCRGAAAESSVATTGRLSIARIRELFHQCANAERL